MLQANAIETIRAAQDALLEQLRLSSVLIEQETAVSLGPPLRMLPSCAWVSCAFEAEVTPGASNLTCYDGEFELAVGIARQGPPAEDGSWSAVRDDAVDLANAVEQLIDADPYIGGTVDVAWVARVAGREALVEKQRRIVLTVTIKAQRELK